MGYIYFVINGELVRVVPAGLPVRERFAGRRRRLAGKGPFTGGEEYYLPAIARAVSLLPLPARRPAGSVPAAGLAGGAHSHHRPGG